MVIPGNCTIAGPDEVRREAGPEHLPLPLSRGGGSKLPLTDEPTLPAVQGLALSARQVR